MPFYDPTLVKLEGMLPLACLSVCVCVCVCVCLLGCMPVGLCVEMWLAGWVCWSLF